MRNSDGKKPNRTKIIIAVLAAVFALGAVACIVCIAVLKLNILYIPMAVCLVFALILFTYYRHSSN